MGRFTKELRNVEVHMTEESYPNCYTRSIMQDTFATLFIDVEVDVNVKLVLNINEDE